MPLRNAGMDDRGSDETFDGKQIKREYGDDSDLAASREAPIQNENHATYVGQNLQAQSERPLAAQPKQTVGAVQSSSDSTLTSADSAAEAEDPSWEDNDSVQSGRRRSGRTKNSKLPAKGPTPKEAVKMPPRDSGKETKTSETEVYETQITKLQEQVKTLKADAKTLKTNLTKQTNRAIQSERLAGQSKRDLEMEKRKAKETQAELQKKLKTAPIVASDDGRMRSMLFKLGELCNRWAEAYAVPDETVNGFNMTERSNILDMFKQEHKAISEIGTAIVFSESMLNCGKLLLTSALTHLIWFDILQCPLYFLRQARAVGGFEKIEDSIEWLVKLGAGGKSFYRCYLPATDKTWRQYDLEKHLCLVRNACQDLEPHFNSHGRRARREGNKGKIQDHERRGIPGIWLASNLAL